MDVLLYRRVMMRFFFDLLSLSEQVFFETKDSISCSQFCSRSQQKRNHGNVLEQFTGFHTDPRSESLDFHRLSLNYVCTSIVNRFSITAIIRWARAGGNDDRLLTARDR